MIPDPEKSSRRHHCLVDQGFCPLICSGFLTAGQISHSISVTTSTKKNAFIAWQPRQTFIVNRSAKNCQPHQAGYLRGRSALKMPDPKDSQWESQHWSSGISRRVTHPKVRGTLPIDVVQWIGLALGLGPSQVELFASIRREPKAKISQLQHI